MFSCLTNTLTNMSSHHHPRAGNSNNNNTTSQVRTMDSFSSSSDYGNDEPSTWISWHCEQPENSFLCEIDYEYIESPFNLFGLKAEVPHFTRYRDIIIEEMESSASDCSSEGVPLKWQNEGSADLYGRIHVRYLNTLQGQKAMISKFMRGQFGRCPLYTCNNQRVLPIGVSDIPGVAKVKVYCPKCQDMYHTNASGLDGAYFGRTFVPFLLLCHPELLPQDSAKAGPPKHSPYVPTLFGFKVHKSSPYWQLRKVPKDDLENCAKGEGDQSNSD